MEELIQQINKNKIFVTGVFCSGKTAFSKLYAKKFKVPFLNFDNTFNYAQHTNYNYVKKYYDELPDRFIIDAVPFHHGWDVFLEYANKQQSQVALIYVVCSNPVIWCFRIIDSKNMFKTVSSKTIGKILYGCFFQFAGLYYKSIPLIENIIEYKIFDTYTNEYITKKELFKRISWASSIFDKENASIVERIKKC